MITMLGHQLRSRGLSAAMKPIHSLTLGALCGLHRFVSSSSILAIPPGSWDSHIHLIEPDRHPLPKNASGPQIATMAQALNNAEQLRLPNLVFVQLSNYRFDNSWILDALSQVGPSRGRGVVSFDPENTSNETLQQWHELGVRGVRVNLRSSNITMSPAEIQSTFRKYAKRIRPMKTWSIGLYADMEMLNHIQPIVPELGVKIVLEHFGSPSVLPLDPTKLPGWQALEKMMEDPRVFVKISAPYIFSNDPQFKDLESLIKSLFGMRNGKGVVFASDWPHTKSPGWDTIPFLNRCVEWCNGDETLLKNLFRENARDLWDVV